MNIVQWQAHLSATILSKIELEVDSLRNSNIRRFDIGVFPWNGWVELSFQCEDEIAKSDDIAAWRHYNFSAVQEGKWLDVESLGAVMKKAWESDPSIAETFFEAVGEMTKSNHFCRELHRICGQEKFEITVLNPDKPKGRNYAT